MPSSGDTLTLWSDQQKSGESYTTYVMHVSYQTDYQTIQCPVSGKDDLADAVFIKTASKTTKKVVKWSAERRCSINTESKPAVPIADVGGNHVLLSEIVTPCVQDVTPDGTATIFRVDGTYTYGMIFAIGAGDNLAVGKYPSDNLTFIQNMLPDAAFVELIDGINN